jgi:hypothetical protein
VTFCLDNTEFSGEPAALPSLVRCNSLLARLAGRYFPLAG